MTNSYSTAADVKALLPGHTWGTTYDALLNTLAVQASRTIDAFLAREPGAFAVGSETTRYFDGSGKRSLWIGELAAVPSAIAVAEGGVFDHSGGTGGTYTAWAAGDYIVAPRNALAKGRPIHWLEISNNGSKAIWYAYPKAVKVTGYFGFATTTNMPDEIRHATEVQTLRWWKRAQQAYADAGANVEVGQLHFVKKLDPEVQAILQVAKFRWP